MRRRGSETRPRVGGPVARDSGGVGGLVDEISEIKLRDGADGVHESDRTDKPAIIDKAPVSQPSPQPDRQHDGIPQRTETSHAQSQNQPIDDSGQLLPDVPLATMTPTEVTTTQNQVPDVSGATDLTAIEWSYLDTQGVVQGEQLQSVGGFYL